MTDFDSDSDYEILLYHPAFVLNGLLYRLVFFCIAKLITAFILIAYNSSYLDCCTSINRKPKYQIENRILTCEQVFGRNMCRNKGTCVVDNKEYRCVCADNFSGKHCEKRIVNNPKAPEESTSTTFKTVCDEPYKSVFCHNTGICYQIMFHGMPEYSCECPYGFHGHRCEFKALNGFYGNSIQ